MKHSIFHVFTVMAIIAIFGFIACGGDDGNGDDIKTVAQPTASPGAGSYAAVQSITLECATNGAGIYYSLDGATPSTLYSDPITISTSTTLKAVAKKSGMNDSTVLTAVYTINIAPITLTGNINISPTTAFTGEELTATYSGSETVNYHWNKDETPIDGKTTNKLTPNEAGSYTVTVSLSGYESKTSAAVVVGAIIDLTGNISISPPTAFIGEELSATYSGSETVNYQWNKDETPIDGKTTNKLTPTDAGSYTVTVSARGYNSKTSAAVAVTIPVLRGDVTITGNAVGGGILTAEISNTNGTDESKFTYQWTRDGEDIPNETNRQYEIVDADDFGKTLGVDVGYEGMTGTISGITPPIAWGVYGIPVIGAEGVTVTEAHVATIKAAVDVIGTWGDEYIPHMNYMKNNVKEFRIITGNDPTWVGMENEKLIVKISLALFGMSKLTAMDEIGGAMLAYAYTNM